MIILKTRYGTKVEYVSTIDDYTVIRYNDTNVRVLTEDLDDESRKKIDELNGEKESISKET